MTAPAGQDFFYNTGALTLVSAIIRKAVGRPLDEFARETLFQPLGITDFAWTRVKGDTDAGGGLRLRPRDMAKIGQLVLAGGRWNDRQIVSKAWIDASMTPRLEATGPYFYGYLWWLGRSLLNGREIHWIGALGRGGQSIRIVPELDVVVVVTVGILPGLQPSSLSSAVLHFQGRLAGNSSVTLNRKRRGSARHWLGNGTFAVICGTTDKNSEVLGRLCRTALTPKRPSTALIHLRHWPCGVRNMRYCATVPCCQ